MTKNVANNNAANNLLIEAVATLEGSADRLTLPFDVLQAMAIHELSQQTVDEFAKNGRVILG